MARPVDRLVAQKAVDDYRAGMSAEVSAKKNGMSLDTVLRYAVKFGVSVRKRSDYHHPCKRGGNRKYSLDEKAFEVTGEGAAYWTGFLMADGSVSERRGKVELTLSYIDSAHVEKFKRFIKSAHPIMLVRGGYTNSLKSRLIVSSKNLSESLARLGVIEGKRKRQCYVKGLEFNPHFWRGMIDGDGCVFMGTLGRPGIQLVGGQILLRQFVSFVRLVIPECKVTVRPHKSIFRVALCAGSALKLIKILYENCTVALSRKVVTAQNIISSMAA